MDRSKFPKSTPRSAVRWGDLPHKRLQLEVRAAVANREPSESHRDIRIEKLELGLPTLDEQGHVEYSNLVVAEVIRDLRICRDVYRAYLASLNSKSRTAKWSVALDYAVAPRASLLLRGTLARYLHHTGVEAFTLAMLFARCGPLIMTQNGVALTGEPTLEGVLGELIHDRAFQDLKDRFTKESFRKGGPFTTPQFGYGFWYGYTASDILKLYSDSQMWISRLSYMWNQVFREIVQQQVQIDLLESADASLAQESLSEFEREAGSRYLEASERYRTIPDPIWQKMGEELDEKRISLLENLEPEGKKVLARLRAHGHKVGKWSEALVCKSDFEVLEAKVVLGGNVKYVGMLSRHAKRAFYRARDNYCAVMERIYEKRVPR